MKFILASLLLVTLVINLEAGKVTWSDDGKAIIAGTEGQGCTQSAFEIEDENTTKANCS